MVDYAMPEFVKDLQKKIKESELYIDEDGNYGLEKESHVTLFPCFDNDVDLEEIKKYLRDLGDYKIFLSDISKFECEDYDVLKCSAKSFVLEETNAELKKHFVSHSDHKVYKPHLTIAYLKQGMADKYLKEILPSLPVLAPKCFHYSWYEDGEQKEVKF